MKLIETAKKIDAPAIVAGAAFLASAGHIVSVVDASNPLFFALAYPIGIDGLLYVGMKAMKERRFVVGTLAILIGAFYSLAFNGHAEGAFVMSKLLIASSMPVCLTAAFVIEHIGRRVEILPEIREIIREVEVPVEIVKTVTVLPELLPIVPLAPKPVAKPKPVAETKKDEKRTDAPKATGGRVASWDVEKAVRLLADGRTDAEILSLVDGLTAKPWQRTKRAVRLIAADASTPDAEIATTCGVSVTHVARIRKARS